MADYDQLAAARQANEQHANAIRETAQQIETDLQETAYEYQRNISEGRGDMAAFYLRQYRALCDEAQKLNADVAASQQPQSPFSAAEQQFIADNQHILSDPKKWNEALAASYALQMRGYNRNDPAYIRGVSIATGALEADGSECREVLSPNAAAEISGVTPELYNLGVQRLAHMKAMGHYKLDES
jgi:hypothetical protein